MAHLRVWKTAACGAALASAMVAGSVGGPAYAEAELAKPLSSTEWHVLAFQVALDRAGFSPGEIDARMGENSDKALRTFQTARGIEAIGDLDDGTAAALGDAFYSPLSSYVIGAHDVAGPFIDSLPRDMMAQAKLRALTYTSIAELLAERFHLSPTLLDRLNPGVRYEAGQELRVPNVEPLLVPEKNGRRPKAEGPTADAVTISISAATRTLSVQDAEGTLWMHAPVSVGSERDPLPSGEFEVRGLYVNPVFHYNPDLFWDANPSHAKAQIAPGPNNPVGYIWIDLNREHLGIHGTPEPSTVGRTQSHGCIRLTNWDVLRLAALVNDGTRVILQ